MPAQQDYRAPLPRRPTSRAAATAEHLARLAPRLTPRDRWLTRMLAEHRVLTSTQLAELAFPSPHAANARLLALHRWRLLDRFQPDTGHGSAPHHYVLDTAGAALLAHEDGLDPAHLHPPDTGAIGALAAPGPHRRRQRLLHRPRPHRPHPRRSARRLVARTPLRPPLRRPRPPRRLRPLDRRHRRDRVLPRTRPGHRDPHPPRRQTQRLPTLSAATGITTPVLFRFRTTTRETNARRALAAALTHLDRSDTVPAATSAADAGPASGPAGPIWLPIRPSRRIAESPPDRISLTELQSEWPQLPPTAPPSPAPAGKEGRLAPPQPMPPPPNGQTW